MTASLRRPALSITLALSGCLPTEFVIEPPPGGWSVTVAARATLEEGATLLPDDPARPGEAAPSAAAWVDGRLLVLLQNLDRYASAGPSHLAVLDPTTLALIDRRPLVIDGEPCRNANSLLVESDRLLVACAGRISLPPDTTDDGRIFELARDGTPLRSVAAGRSPLGLARAGEHLFMGDGEGGVTLVRADTLEVVAGDTQHPPLQPCVVDETHLGFAADVASVGDRLFAACFGDDTVVELDAVTGAPVGSPLPTGAGPLKLTAIDGRLYVLDNLGGTLTVIDPGPPASSAPAQLRLGRDGTQGGNDPQGLDGANGLAGVTNSAYGTFVLLSLDDPRLLAAADLKTSPEAATHFPTTVVQHDGTFWVVIPGLEYDTRAFPSEVVRLEVRAPVGGTTR